MYKPNPKIITGGTSTGNIKQIRRMKMGKRPKKKRYKGVYDTQRGILERIGVLKPYRG